MNSRQKVVGEWSSRRGHVVPIAAATFATPFDSIIHDTRMRATWEISGVRAARTTDIQIDLVPTQGIPWEYCVERGYSLPEELTVPTLRRHMTVGLGVHDLGDYGVALEAIMTSRIEDVTAVLS